MKIVPLNTLRICVLVAIVAVLIVLPSIFSGGLYGVGGDDTRMYYLIPKILFEHYSSAIITQNRLGTYGLYASPAFLTPFYVCLWIISTVLPHVNLQFVMYGCNMAFGFLFFYLFLGLYFSERSWRADMYKITAAITYIFSNFLVTTLYSHRLLSVFAISVCPIILYLFIRAVRENNYIFAFVGTLVYSLVSATLISLPWYGAFFFSVIPLLLYELKQRPLAFIKMLGIFFVTSLVLNFHWIIHIFESQIIGQNNSSVLSLSGSINMAKTNTAYISAISQLNTILAQLFQQERTGWGVPIYFNPLNSIFLLVLLLGGIYFHKMKNYPIRSVYFVSIFSFLLTIILFTPNVDQWSLKLFLFLNSHIPLFSMFRTAYDKFSLALAFQYSLLLAFSLYIIDKKNKYLMVFLSIGLILISIFSATDHLFPKYSDSKFSYRISGELNNDFNNLVTYLRKMDTGAHFVWLPLTFPSYIYIEDGKLPNHFYSGPSLITPLTGKIDYSGELSFEVPKRPGISSTIVESLQAKNYDAVGKIFQELGIRYVIVNNQKIPDSAKEYKAWLWGSNRWDILQTPEFINHLKGKHIASFGDRYELYEIHEKYKTDVLYLTHSLKKVETIDALTYVKDNEGEYTVTIENLTDKEYLVLLEPYYKAWKIYLQDENGKFSIPYAVGTNTLVFNNGNAWELDPMKIKKSIVGSRVSGESEEPLEFKLKIIFEPKRLQHIGNTVSIAGYGIVLVIILFGSIQSVADVRKKKIFRAHI